MFDTYVVGSTSVLDKMITREMTGAFVDGLNMVTGGVGTFSENYFVNVKANQTPCIVSI